MVKVNFYHCYAWLYRVLSIGAGPDVDHSYLRASWMLNLIRLTYFLLDKFDDMVT
jgi:hypothetical protein